MEMLVAMALFVTIAFVLSDILLRNSFGERKVLKREEAQAEASILFAGLAEKIGLSRIDYENLKIGEELVLVAEDGKIRKLFFSGEENSILEEWDGELFALHSDKLFIGNFSWELYPQEDPFFYDEQGGFYLGETMPIIKLFLTARHKEGLSDEFSLQTAVVPKYYGR